MSYLLHNGIVVFIAYLVLMLAAAWVIGRALSSTWRPLWHIVPYTILLSLAGRFVFWAVSGGDNFSFFESFEQVYIDVVVLLAVAALSYRVTRARKMVTQYPWLYELTGPLSWRERQSQSS